MRTLWNSQEICCFFCTLFAHYQRRYAEERRISGEDQSGIGCREDLRQEAAQIPILSACILHWWKAGHGDLREPG